MGLFAKEPGRIVHSLPELMAIAKAMEEEAAARYRQLARRMKDLGNQAATQTFDRLAHEEDAHAQKVEELSVAVVGAAPARAAISWELPGELADEAMSDLGTSRLVTPYRALSIAVRNEERAFAFWTYVSAYAPNAQIRSYAEILAREELRHASILRRERRRAYRSQPPRAPQPSKRDPGVSPCERLRRAAAFLEPGVINACLTLAAADRMRDDETTAHLLAKIAEESEANMRAVGLDGGATLSPRPSAPATSLETLDAVIAAAEAAADAYLELADSALDESVVAAAQRLTGSAIERLVWLRERRGDLAPLPLDEEP